MKHSGKLLSAIIACSVACSAHAATVWDEALNGDFSNDGLAPTPVTFALGDNQIIGTTGDAGLGQGVDRDYFTFTVPTGMVLSSLILFPDTSVSGSSSFLGLQAGPQLTVTPTGGGVQDLIGLLHYDPSMAGSDVLPLLLVGGRAAPLPSGVYSAWVQELGGTVPYSFDFKVSAAPVPVPASAIFLVVGLAAILVMRRGREGIAA